MSVTFIDRTDSQNPERRENYWIHTLKTKGTWGLYLLEQHVWATLFSFTGFLGPGMFNDKIYGILLLRMLRICMYVCVCVCVYMLIYGYIYMYMCICVYVCMCVYLYIIYISYYSFIYSQFTFIFLSFLFHCFYCCFLFGSGLFSLNTIRSERCLWNVSLTILC